MSLHSYFILSLQGSIKYFAYSSKNIVEFSLFLIFPLLGIILVIVGASTYGSKPKPTIDNYYMSHSETKTIPLGEVEEGKKIYFALNTDSENMRVSIRIVGESTEWETIGDWQHFEDTYTAKETANYELYVECWESPSDSGTIEYSVASGGSGKIWLAGSGLIVMMLGIISFLIIGAIGNSKH